MEGTATAGREKPSYERTMPEHGWTLTTLIADAESVTDADVLALGETLGEVHHLETVLELQVPHDVKCLTVMARRYEEMAKEAHRTGSESVEKRIETIREMTESEQDAALEDLNREIGPTADKVYEYQSKARVCHSLALTLLEDSIGRDACEKLRFRKGWQLCKVPDMGDILENLLSTIMVGCVHGPFNVNHG